MEGSDGTRYDEATGTCPYWREIDNPREHREYVLYNVVFSGECDAFTLQGLQGRLVPYGLGMSDDELRQALAAYVNHGFLYPTLDGWEVTRSAPSGRRHEARPMTTSA